MNVNIEIKIKLDKGKELTLSGDDAKELYLKLKEIYEERHIKEYVPYPYQPYRWPWYVTTIYGTSGTYTITQSDS